MSQNQAQAERQQQSPRDGASPRNQPERPTLPPIIPTGPNSHNGTRRNSASSTMSPASAAATPAPAEPQSSRSLRMHSILNPSNGQHVDKREPSQMAMPFTALNASAPGSGHTTPIRTLPPMASLPALGAAGQSNEQTHYPHRSVPPTSIGLSTPSSSVDPRRSPFLAAAHVGTNSGPTRSGYPFPYQQAPSASDRRGSDTLTTAPPSQSNSPTTSYSSYAQTNRNSPTPHYQQQQYYANHGPNGAQMTMAAEAAFRGGAPGAVQSTYQMMTLDTDQGPIQVPVDVQAASKMADEKRKRNAGASARFRQRRKEKEREAGQTISKLESKLRQVGEEKEYYRMERDYFRGLVYNSPAQVHVTPRMPSPKPRQMSEGSSTGTADWQQSGERGSDDGRNTRRRISGYSEGPMSAPAPAPAPTHNQHPHYPPGPYQYPGHDPRAQAGRPPMSAPLPPQPNPYGQGPPPGYGRA
jgi:hypothetical protein